VKVRRHVWVDLELQPIKGGHSLANEIQGAINPNGHAAVEQTFKNPDKTL
jgi:hypothetical protein